MAAGPSTCDLRADLSTFAADAVGSPILPDDTNLDRNVQNVVSLTLPSGHSAWDWNAMPHQHCEKGSHPCRGPRHEELRRKSPFPHFFLEGNLVVCKAFWPSHLCMSCFIDERMLIEVHANHLELSLKISKQRDLRHFKESQGLGRKGNHKDSVEATADDSLEDFEVPWPFPTPEQVYQLPLLRGVIAESIFWSPGLHAEIERFVVTGDIEVNPEVFAATDLELIAPVERIPAAFQRFNCFHDRMVRMKMSVDIEHPLFELKDEDHEGGDAKVSTFPFHHPLELQLIPAAENIGKVRTHPLTVQFVETAISVNHDETLPAKHREMLLAVLEKLIRALKPINSAYWNASSPTLSIAARTQAVEDSTKLEELFNPTVVDLNGWAPYVDAGVEYATPPDLQVISEGYIKALTFQERVLDHLYPYVATFVALTKEYETTCDGVTFLRNDDGFPTVWWATNTSTHDTLLFALAVFKHAMAACDRMRIPTEGFPPLTVIFVWCHHFAKWGYKDQLTGLKFGFTGPHDVLAPTLLAHSIHRVAFATGFLTPYPSSLDEFDPSRMTVRVELRQANFLVRTMRLPSLLALVRGARDDCQRIVDRVVDVLDLERVELVKEFSLVPATAEAYRLNSTSSYERIVLFPDAPREVSFDELWAICRAKKIRCDYSRQEMVELLEEKSVPNAHAMSISTMLKLGKETGAFSGKGIPFPILLRKLEDHFAGSLDKAAYLKEDGTALASPTTFASIDDYVDVDEFVKSVPPADIAGCSAKGKGPAYKLCVAAGIRNTYNTNDMVWMLARAEAKPVSDYKDWPRKKLIARLQEVDLFGKSRQIGPDKLKVLLGLDHNKKLPVHYYAEGKGLRAKESEDEQDEDEDDEPKLKAPAKGKGKAKAKPKPKPNPKQKQTRKRKAKTPESESQPDAVLSAADDSSEEVKIYKPGKVAVVLNGRQAGKKVVVIQQRDEGTKERPYPHAIVAGIERYPLKVTKSMGKKKVAKRSKVKPFIKVVNYSHLLPTRYVLELESLKGAVTNDTFKEPTQRVESKKAIKKAFEERYAKGANRWFFSKLRF